MSQYLTGITEDTKSNVYLVNKDFQVKERVLLKFGGSSSIDLAHTEVSEL